MLLQTFVSLIQQTQVTDAHRESLKKTTISHDRDRYNLYQGITEATQMLNIFYKFFIQIMRQVSRQ